MCSFIPDKLQGRKQLCTQPRTVASREGAGQGPWVGGQCVCVAALPVSSHPPNHVVVQVHVVHMQDCRQQKSGQNPVAPHDGCRVQAHLATDSTGCAGDVGGGWVWVLSNS